MQTALKKLLARPSALRLLQAITISPPSPVPNGLPLNHSSKKLAGPLTPWLTRNICKIQTLPSNPTQTLSRTRQHPSTWEELNFQSDVACGITNPLRLVDGINHRDDFALWVRLLDFRKRVYGADGVAQIWTGIMVRNVELPTAGELAQSLWDQFLSQEHLIHEVFEYAKTLRERTGRYYENLYEVIVRYHLKTNVPHSAIEWHLNLIEAFPPKLGALQRLGQIATQNQQHHALNAFQSIYLRSRERGIYDCLVPSLWEQDQFSEARSWHEFLIRHGDGPSTSLINTPLVQLLSLYDPYLESNPVDHSATPNGRKHSIDPSHNVMKGVPFSREFINRIIGDAHHVKPKELDERFIARLFATKSFSLDSIISGLGMFGVEAIGPLSMRELVSRVGSITEIRDNLQKLKELGISLGDSIFSKAIESFTNTGRADMIHELLSSDQHPEVLEDRELQKRLLSAYVSSQNWPRTHLTLMVLTLFHSDPITESWNLLLGVYLEGLDRAKAARVLDDMRLNNVEISTESLSLTTRLLRVRNPGKKPNWKDHNYDDLNFVSNAFLAVLASGHSIPASRWQELIWRYGVHGKLQELENLLLLLDDWYNPNTAVKTRTWRLNRFKEGTKWDFNTAPNSSTSFRLEMFKSTPQWSSEHPLRRIFSPRLQTALVEWGFIFQPALPEIQRKGNFRYPRKDPYWGLRLLAGLANRGVLVQRAHIRKVVRLRLWILFGPSHSLRKHNQKLKKQQASDLKSMVRDIERIWGRSLFETKPARSAVPPGNSYPKSWLSMVKPEDDQEEKDVQFVLHIFGPRMWVSKRRRIGVSIEPWARSALRRYGRGWLESLG